MSTPTGIDTTLVGTIWKHPRDGFTYRCIEIIKREGKSPYAVWAYNCASCKRETTQTSSVHYPYLGNRRCAAHKRRGTPSTPEAKAAMLRGKRG